mmetsp:Transcript_60852/g.162792  ORF Transcript_60852/g.162792 Transcript_60852/m.162792 type:complete len:281 (+) Transcript_60852:453-1295(+)
MAALLEEVGDSGAAGDGLLRLRHLVEEQEVAPLPGVRVVGVRVIRDGGRVTRDGANGRAGRNTNTNINNSNLKAQAKFESANAHRLQHHHHGPPIAPTPPTPTSTPPSPTMAPQHRGKKQSPCPQHRGKKQSPCPHQAAVELQDGGHVAAAVAVVGRGPHRHQVLLREHVLEALLHQLVRPVAYKKKSPASAASAPPMQNSASPASESCDNHLVRPAGIIPHQQRDQLLLLRTLNSVASQLPTVASAPATPLQNSASELLRVSEPRSFALNVPRFHKGRF